MTHYVKSRTNGPRAVHLIFACIAIAVGCGGCKVKPPLPDVYWPDPPDKPRIKYVRSFQSKDDVGGVSLRELVVGSDKTLALYQPMGVAVSADGQRLYVADRAWNLVIVFNFKTGAFTTIGDQERFPLAWPVGVALDGDENVYVSDTGSRTVRVYDKAGQFLRVVGKDLLVRPTGVAIDVTRRRLYVVDTGQTDTPQAHRVKAFDLDGHLLQEIGRRGDGDGEFNFPTFASVDAEGRLYVVDSVNNRIEIFDPNGRFLRKFGQSGDRIGDFARPKGVAVDNAGNIYVVDSQWSNVQIFNQEGQLLLIFGGVGTYPGLLMNPSAIAIDRDNNIYVSDTLGRRVSLYRLIDSAPADGGDAQATAIKSATTEKRGGG
ncbi:MAG TPA: 6-bladed beta-propeller [Candidatus Binatia bacterium]|nr:6-bladed beta-propeller [Candidatus Binatia bacterium]